jgi:hypothetical protein|tara:strand:- start:29 stop:304 length:276 start_codon:yes stop_codon:yes gene_type:complete
VIELIAAVAGGLITVSGIAAGSAIRKSGESRDVIVKLSAGFENVGREIQALRQDMKDDRHEIYGRLSNIEQRISSLEAFNKSGCYDKLDPK